MSDHINPTGLPVGSSVKFRGDHWWWLTRASSEQFSVLTRQARFHPKDTLQYTVIDWAGGLRGPCNLIGQGYGDGSYDDSQCAEMLAEFVADDLQISHRNNVPLIIVQSKDLDIARVTA